MRADPIDAEKRDLWRSILIGVIAGVVAGYTWYGGVAYVLCPILACGMAQRCKVKYALVSNTTVSFVLVAFFWRGNWSDWRFILLFLIGGWVVGVVEGKLVCYLQKRSGEQP